MKKPSIEELVVVWLDCEHDPQQRADIEKELAAQGYDLAQLQELQELNTQMGALHTPKASERMTDNFYEMLSVIEKRDRQSRDWLAFFRSLITPAPRLAAALVYGLALLIIGWGVGRRSDNASDYAQQFTSMSAEIQEMKEMVTLTLLQHPAPGERLQGLSRVSTLDTVDESIIHALIMTLKNDPNVDVRLMTIKSLTRFSDRPQVRECLVHAISTQTEPEVLLLLADVMISLHETDSVPSLQRLLTMRELDPNVKDKIEKSILTLL